MLANRITTVANLQSSITRPFAYKPLCTWPDDQP